MKKKETSLTKWLKEVNAEGQKRGGLAILLIKL